MKGFESPETETEFLRRRLKEEQESAQRAHQARMEAESRCQVAEEERDVYRVLARRYQLRLETALRRSGRAGYQEREEDEEEMAPLNGHGARGLSGREQAVIFGLGAMLRSIQYEDDDEEDDDDDDDDVDDIDEEEGDDGGEEGHNSNGMEEDTSIHGQDNSNESMEEHDEEDDDESDSEDNPSSYLPLAAQGMVAAMSHASAMVVRPQRRTVSITGHDL